MAGASIYVAFEPLLDLNQAAGLPLEAKSSLITELTQNYQTDDELLSQLAAFSDPFAQALVSNLWQEAINIARGKFRITDPLHTKLLAEALEGPPPGPLSSDMYLDIATVTFESLVDAMKYARRELLEKLSLVETSRPTPTAQTPLKMSNRPLGEVVMQAMHLSSLLPGSSSQVVTNVLTSFPNMTTGNPRPGMAGMYQSRLTSPHMLQDQNFNPMNPKPRMGGVACIAAAWNGKELSTGSTLIKWGTQLGALRVGWDDMTLHEWYRDQRQSRFSADQQRAVDALVDLYLNAYDEQLTQRCQTTERNVLLMKESPNKKAAKGRLRAAKVPARQALGMNLFPGAVLEVLQEYRDNTVGLSYEGGTSAIKAKCPGCQLLYPFRWVPGAPSASNQLIDFNVVAELDPRKHGSSRGCCAEALVFVHGMWALGLGERLLEALGLPV